MNKSNYLNIIISVFLILLIGLGIGYTVGYYHSTKNHFPEIKFVGEVNPGIATIKLMEVKSGKLIGEIAGRSARLVYGADNIIELKKDDKFAVPISQIDLKSYYQAEYIPPNTQYIASKKGKYYKS